jgi:hypothetical protein
MLKADANGFPVDAANTDAEVSAAVTASHAAATVADTASLDMSISGQQISGAVLPAGVDHNSLANLTTGDPHTEYTDIQRNKQETTANIALASGYNGHVVGPWAVGNGFTFTIADGSRFMVLND